MSVEFTTPERLKSSTSNFTGGSKVNMILTVGLCVFSLVALAQEPVKEDPTLPKVPVETPTKATVDPTLPKDTKAESTVAYGATSNLEAKKVADQLKVAVISLRELLLLDEQNFRGKMSLTVLDDMRIGSQVQRDLLLSEYRTPWLNAMKVAAADHSRVSLENLFNKGELRKGVLWNLKEAVKSVEEVASVKDRWLLDLKLRNRIAFFAQFLSIARDRIDNANGVPADKYREMVSRITDTQIALLEASRSLHAFYKAYETDGYGTGYHADWFSLANDSFGTGDVKIGIYLPDSKNVFSTYRPTDSSDSITLE